MQRLQRVPAGPLLGRWGLVPQQPAISPDQMLRGMIWSDSSGRRQVRERAPSCLVSQESGVAVRSLSIRPEWPPLPGPNLPGAPSLHRLKWAIK
jgi:hypothetical protein